MDTPVRFLPRLVGRYFHPHYEFADTRLLCSVKVRSTWKTSFLPYVPQYRDSQKRKWVVCLRRLLAYVKLSLTRGLRCTYSFCQGLSRSSHVTQPLKVSDAWWAQSRAWTAACTLRICIYSEAASEVRSDIFPLAATLLLFMCLPRFFSLPAALSQISE